MSSPAGISALTNQTQLSKFLTFFYLWRVAQEVVQKHEDRIDFCGAHTKMDSLKTHCKLGGAIQVRRHKQLHDRHI